MKVIPFIFCMLFSLACAAQQPVFTLETALDFALKNNPGMIAADYQIASDQQLVRSSFDLPKTQVLLLAGQYNSYAKADRNYTVTQSVPFSVWGSQRGFNRAKLTSAKLEKAVFEHELTFQIKSLYYQLRYKESIGELLDKQLEIYGDLYRVASERLKNGEGTMLESLSAETQFAEVKNRQRDNDAEQFGITNQLHAILNTPELPQFEKKSLAPIEIDLTDTTVVIAENAAVKYSRQQVEVASRERKIQSAAMAPDLVVGLFSQSLIGTPDPKTKELATSSQRFTGFQVGISLPIWFVSQSARMKASAYQVKKAESTLLQEQNRITAEMETALRNMERNKTSLEYYQSTALEHSELMINKSEVAFKAGDIEYSEYLLSLRSAILIKENYLRVLNDFNQSVILFQYYAGSK